MILAHALLGELFGYAGSLWSLTRGRGSSAMTFDDYAEVPGAIASKVIDAL